ncbi:MAG: DUF1127 domain-containing protein [Gammaproteobacteria bacterium]|nr:DUF1127 domain-containing protein [Gammaproteobacteria bacterium]NIR83702.1 DUF1127 domain-containing protein [Gammaproteobacteria bacterium]NIR91849.1 DUF1127 domain-containing protein [Gammaproteobacteria bacterium]NIU04868.1 DUF1127 domain-containing protein [Gammaproteobacteria bacterium]NIV51850.1 DUF1127 domain-containing protein [Gammaproteobacteria bacterium]
MNRTDHSPCGLQHHDQPARARAGGGSLTSLVGAGKRVITHLRRARRRRQAINELSALSDAQLADIGVMRELIPEIVDGLLHTQGDLQAGREPERATRTAVQVRAVPDCPECA